MKKPSTLIFLIPFLTVIFCSGSLMQAQTKEETEKRREQEHRAVEQYLRDGVRNAPKAAPSSVKKKDQKQISPAKVNDAFVEGEKSFFMNGNNINVELFNYGGIAPGYPGASIREIGSMVWRNLPYIFQFGPIVGAAVPDTSGKNIHIITDGLYDYPNYIEQSPTGERWVWKPLPGYADPDQPYMASNPAFDSDRDGKPDSWPRDWYNETLGEYVWPGYLTQGENNADLETFWAMDDRANREFPYFPFINDTVRRGLGIQIDARAFQWSNSLAANSIFMVYTITNVSDKDLDTVFFGIYGDPDVGGLDNDDDNGYFIPPYSIEGRNVDNIPVYARSMVYFWDPDMKGDRGLPLGYLGCKFLESPGHPFDLIDNDGDGLTDERQDDGIDNDNDWNAETDDVGVDGIPNTQDAGEGDGVPTAGQRLPDGSPDPLQPGEPNFEYTDLDESDQIGLTSFNSWTWGEEKISNDESIWFRNQPGNFGEIAQNADINFTFGSGYISLKKGESKRISMAFLFGENLNDLLVTAETVQDIYNKNYRFFKPPALPSVTAVPGDKKVTLYWDTAAEESEDPITGEDFEGYVIYRSTDPNFSDILTVTDGRGSSFLSTPLRTVDGFDAKFDLDNEWRGYHPVPYQGRGLQYYIGDNSGLVHTFVDSNNVINGQTYYYAVVAYDHGDSLGIPPSETTKKISVDPITSALFFDKNTVQVIPGPRAGGYIKPEITDGNVDHQKGYGNGGVNFRILNDLAVKDNEYRLNFSDSLITENGKIKQLNYSIIATEPVSETVQLYDTKFADLGKTNIINDEALSITDDAGTAYNVGTDYQIDFTKGQIKRLNDQVPAKITITYRYYPVYQSTALQGEDSNPTFDGIHVSVNSHTEVSVDTSKTGWIAGENKLPYTVWTSTNFSKVKYPADYEVTFSDQNEWTALIQAGSKLLPIPVPFKVEDITTGVPIPVVVRINEKIKKDSSYSRGEDIILATRYATGEPKDTLTWIITFGPPTVGDSAKAGAGDVFRVTTNRPYTKEDEFILTTSPGMVSQQKAAEGMDNIYVVPNPYIVTNELEPANRLASQNRGERRIYFENLPQQCTIRIFTLSGELVTTLQHDASMTSGRAYWNLLNRDGFSVAYGIYLAHIEAPGVGEKLIKFALIK